MFLTLLSYSLKGSSVHGYKNILVHFVNSQDYNKRLQPNLKVANIFDSHVNAIYVADPVPYNSYGYSIAAGIYNVFDEINMRKSQSARDLYKTESAG